MPCLTETRHTGTITWVGHVPTDASGIRAEPMVEAHTTFDGIGIDRHAGATRLSCVRVTMLHDKGTEIRNTRQLSVLSQEELDSLVGGGASRGAGE